MKMVTSSIQVESRTGLYDILGSEGAGPFVVFNAAARECSWAAIDLPLAGLKTRGCSRRHLGGFWEFTVSQSCIYAKFKDNSRLFST